MNSALYDKVRSLLETSLALQTHPEEQWFWLLQIKTMNEKGLKKLAEILEKEQENREKILQTQSQKLAGAQEEYLSGLQDLKHRGLPSFLKILEANHKAKENPEDLLNAL